MFYKNDNGCLLQGIDILNEGYHLTIEDITIQVDGWAWFNTEGEARIAYDLVL